MTPLQCFEKSHPGFKSGGDVRGQDCFIRMMADPAGTAQKQHRSGHAASNNHGIVARAACHAMNRMASVCDGALQHCDEMRNPSRQRLDPDVAPNETVRQREAASLLGASQ